MGIDNVNFADALFSKVKQRVLGRLYGQPDRAFSTNELIRLTQMGTGAVQRELIRLLSAGLITVNQIGNQKCYQANRDTPLFQELRSIVLKTFGLADLLREALVPIASRIQTAFIYGSIASQQETASSDIDIMIIGDNITYGDLFETFSEIEVQLGRKTNPTFYSPTDWVKKLEAENHFVIEVMSQPKIFLIGSEDGLGKT